MEEKETDLEYEQFLKSLGARIKQLRNERGLSLRDMVIQHGYHDSQWRRYERGGAINVQSLLKIAKVFQLSLAKLLDGVGEYSQKPVPEPGKKKAVAKRTSDKPSKQMS